MIVDGKVERIINDVILESVVELALPSCCRGSGKYKFAYIVLDLNVLFSLVLFCTIYTNRPAVGSVIDRTMWTDEHIIDPPLRRFFVPGAARMLWCY